MSSATNATQRHPNATRYKEDTALSCTLSGGVSGATFGFKHFTRARTQVNVSLRGSSATYATQRTYLAIIISKPRVALLVLVAPPVWRLS